MIKYILYKFKLTSSELVLIITSSSVLYLNPIAVFLDWNTIILASSKVNWIGLIKE